MAKPSQKTIRKRRPVRSIPAGTSSKIEPASSASHGLTLFGLAGELSSFRERSGSVASAAYARLASVVLGGIERLEDLNAERRSRHARAGSPATSSAQDPASLAEDPITTRTASV